VVTGMIGRTPNTAGRLMTEMEAATVAQRKRKNELRLWSFGLKLLAAIAFSVQLVNFVINGKPDFVVFTVFGGIAIVTWVSALVVDFVMSKPRQESD